MDHFSESLGFGEYKSEAIRLLRTTIDILNEFNIQHMLISGTLLGYIRHNDFIPWDDDIDILVDSTILRKKELIVEKYPNINLFFKTKYDSIKICFNTGLQIPNSYWNEYGVSLTNEKKKYYFPFVDMFIFDSGPGAHICGKEELIEIEGQYKMMFFPFSGACDRSFRFLKEDKLVIFHNYWKKEYFFPLVEVDFLGIRCNIPNKPHYFLKKNYGKDYMNVIKSPEFHHKTNTFPKDIISRDYVRK